MIRVGGATEVEVKERKDRVDDALHATRAAVEEGILPGGGIALLRAFKALDRLSPANPDQKAGIEIVRRALQVPARLIAQNAGDDGSVVVGKLWRRANTIGASTPRLESTRTSLRRASLTPPRWSGQRFRMQHPWHRCSSQPKR